MKTLRTLLVCLAGVCSVGAEAAPGELDGAFGSGGFLVVPPGGSSTVMMPDGSLVIAGFESGSLRLQKLDKDGSPVPGPGPDGVRELLRGRLAAAGVTAAAPARDGSLFVAMSSPSGTLGEGGKVSSYLVRVTPQGDVDSGFGTDGLVRFDPDGSYFSNYSRIDSIATLPDGAVAFIESVYDGSPYDCASFLRLRRLGGDGLPSPGFPSKVELMPTCYEPGIPLVGLAAGVAGVPGLSSERVASPLLFDSSGRKLSGAVPPVTMDSRVSMSTSSDGSRDYVLQTYSGAEQLRLARLLPDLTLDGSFGPMGTGEIVLDLSGQLAAGEFIGQVQVLGDGSYGHYIYTAAQLYSPDSVSRLAIHRLNLDGSVDTRFGHDGLVIVEGAGWAWRLLGEQPDGCLMVEFTEAGRLLRLQSAASPGGAGVLSLVRPGAGSQSREGAQVLVRVSRSLGTRGSVSVNYRLKGQSARPGVDYQDVSGTLTWADGETGPKDFSFALLRNELVNANQGVDVVLESPQGGAVLLRSSGGVSIISTPAVVPTAPSAPASPPAPVAQVPGGGGNVGPGGICLLLALLLLRFMGASGARSPRSGCVVLRGSSLRVRQRSRRCGWTGERWGLPLPGAG